MGETERSTMPVHGTITGVAVVTIPLDHYSELLNCRRLVAEHNLRRQVVVGATSRAERDPEVAAFLAENFIGHTIDRLHDSCRERFGADRTPSRSSIQRFRNRLRSA